MRLSGFARWLLMLAIVPPVLLLRTSPALPHDGNTDPNSVHACVGKVTKVVRIVGVGGRCFDSHPYLAETAVHWAAAASAPSTPSTPPLRFVDATGKLVGMALDRENAAIDIGGGTLIAVGLSRSGFFQTGEPDLWYGSEDCTGTGLLYADLAFNFAYVHGSLATYIDFSAATTTTIRSTRDPSFGCQSTDFEALVGPALTFDLAPLGLVPPFTLAQ